MINIQQVKQMMQTMQNPMSAIKDNPEMQQVLQMCQGKNPKDLFYSLCKQRNVNPDDILKQLK